MRARNNLKPNKMPRKQLLHEMNLDDRDLYFRKLIQKEPHLEKHLHVACVSYMRDHYPEVIINHTKNQTTAHGNAQSVAYGYCKGYPDLFIAFNNNKYPGLFVELKTPRSKGQVRDEQKHVHRALREHGYLVEVIWTYEDFKDLINTYIATKYENTNKSERN